MLTVTVEFHVKENTLEKLRTAVENKILPAAGNNEGFLGGAFLESPGQNRVFEVIFWEDRESYDRFTKSEEFSRAKEDMGKIFQYPPTIRFYENTRLAGKIFDRKALLGYK